MSDWAAIKENKKVGEGVYRLRLTAPAIAQAARPGQFVMLRVSHGLDPLLARPFSIHGVQGDDLLILYKVVGKGTRLLSLKRPGNKTLSLWGPLGRGFDLDVERPVLVAGGMGIAPLAFAEAELSKRNVVVKRFYGGSSKQEINAIKNSLKNYLSSANYQANSAKFIKDILPFFKQNTNYQQYEKIVNIDKQRNATELDNHINKYINFKLKRPSDMPFTTGTTLSFINSIDGSIGDKGLVTDNFIKLFEAFPFFAGCVLACGPLPMLKAVAQICAQRGVPCQVSLEAPMACGLGACLGCVIPAAGGGYVRACQEGPVMDAALVDWERINP